MFHVYNTRAYHGVNIREVKYFHQTILNRVNSHNIHLWSNLNFRAQQNMIFCAWVGVIWKIDSLTATQCCYIAWCHNINRTCGSVVVLHVSLLLCLSPLQAEACKSVEYAMKKCPNGMYSEVKYDGERVQVHKRGNEFRYFSRSLKPVLPHKVSV
jgi:hypothetical protein